MRPLWGGSPLVVAWLCSPRVDGSSAGSESRACRGSGSLVGAGVAKDAGAGVGGAERWIHRTSMSCALKVPRLNLADAATPRRRPRVGCVDRVRLVYGRPRGDPRRHAQPGRGSLRETVAPWVVALLASGALVLFVELNPTKPDHHTRSVPRSGPEL